MTLFLRSGSIVASLARSPSRPLAMSSKTEHRGTRGTAKFAFRDGSEEAKTDGNKLLAGEVRQGCVDIPPHPSFLSLAAVITESFIAVAS